MTSPQVPASRRARLICCWEVQSAILIRCATYAVAGVTYFCFMMVCAQWTYMPEQPIEDVLIRFGEDSIYWLPGLLILAPLAVHDLLKTTASIAGPVIRLQNEMKLLLNCRSERPIRFRDGDHWPELGGTYNQVRGELLMLRRQVAEYEAAAQGVPIVEAPLVPAREDIEPVLAGSADETA